MSDRHARRTFAALVRDLPLPDTSTGEDVVLLDPDGFSLPPPRRLQTPNRVALADIEGSITRKQFVTGSDLNELWKSSGVPDTINSEQLEVLTICILQVSNGFTVIGKAAPADAGNFDADLGKKFAYEDAVQQLWPLYRFALREKLASEG